MTERICTLRKKGTKVPLHNPPYEAMIVFWGHPTSCGGCNITAEKRASFLRMYERVVLVDGVVVEEVEGT